MDISYDLSFRLSDLDFLYDIKCFERTYLYCMDMFFVSIKREKKDDKSYIYKIIEKYLSNIELVKAFIFNLLIKARIVNYSTLYYLWKNEYKLFQEHMDEILDGCLVIYNFQRSKQQYANFFNVFDEIIKRALHEMAKKLNSDEQYEIKLKYIKQFFVFLKKTKK
jgi:hypothetical protein